MKSINEKFTDEEFNKLHKLKGKLSWHDFILFVSNSHEEIILETSKKIDKLHKTIDKLFEENIKLKEELKTIS